MASRVEDQNRLEYGDLAGVDVMMIKCSKRNHVLLVPTPLSKIFIRCVFGILFLVSTAAPSSALSLGQVRNICGFQFPESIFRGEGWAAVNSSDWRRDKCSLAFNATAMLCVLQGKSAVGNSQTALSRKEACDVVLATNLSSVPGLKSLPSFILYDRNQQYGGRGRAYSALGEYDLAISDLTKAIEGRGWKLFEFQWYLARALAYYGLGRYDGALADLDSAVESSIPAFFTYDWEKQEYKKHGFDIDHPAKNVLIEPKALDDAETSIFNRIDAGRRTIFTHVDEGYKKGVWLTLQQLKQKSRLELFGGGEMRGDIYLAKKDYGLALRYYEHYSRAFPEKPGLAEKISLAKKMMELAKSGAPLPPPQPGSPSPLPPACKMYPNLC